MTRPQIQIRHAEPNDADEWRRLRLALWPDEEPAALTADIVRFFATPGRGPGTMPEAVLVAAAGGSQSLVGFAEVSRRLYAEGCETSPVAFLEGWYVDPEYRQQGIGRALVAAAEVWGQASGCREFASDALAENSVSAAAHRALGFEEVVIIRCFRKSLPTEAPI